MASQVAPPSSPPPEYEGCDAKLPPTVDDGTNHLENGTFEWLASFDAYAGELRKELGPAARAAGGRLRIVNIGCGYSLLHEDLYATGYFEHVCNTDMKREALQIMSKRGGHRGAFSWVYDDARDSKLPDSAFDAVIDKSTLDFVLAQGIADGLRMAFHAHRVLKPGGLYVVVSMHPPRIVVPIITPPQYAGNCKTSPQCTRRSAPPRHCVVPPRKGAPSSARPTHLYIYRKRGSEPLFIRGAAGLKHAVAAVQTEWARRQPPLTGAHTKKLEGEFRRRAAPSLEPRLAVAEAHKAMFDSVEKIAQDYPLDDFVEDLELFRRKRGALTAGESQAKGFVTLREALAFLQAMG